MRLDKFLKVSRLIKRRSVANDACNAGRVEINGKVAKSGTPVSVNDVIQISFGNNVVKVRVDAIKDTTKKEDADSMFTYLNE
jgi:ribosomal 50S subunit-recycling heat shock protein